MSLDIHRREIVSEPDLPEAMHPVLKRVYAARNIHSASDLDYSLTKLLSYTLLGNIDSAAQLLKQAIIDQRKVLIVADYDADGATACALAIRGLRMMGLDKVDFIVPDRFVHGYGLSTDIVELALELNPDILVTVDNGISSLDGVALARAKGIDVLITDHHLPGEVLPDANVIVNPNLRDDPFPSKATSGVGVMFYVLAALRGVLREEHWFQQQGLDEPRLDRLLDLVALGTVADVVPLDFNNRIFVAQGLERIRRGICAPGIKSLLTISKRAPEKIVSSDLGFALGPRLNAAGRLTDMRLGIECLICDDHGESMRMASQLDQINKERREIQADMEVDALKAIDHLDLDDSVSLPNGLCLFHEQWHQGVVGIVASKIKERINRPVIAFARENTDLLKGSARSISNVHIRDALEAIATANPDLIEKYGGHAMAAGLSLKQSNYERFCACFEIEIAKRISASGIARHLLSDGGLQESELSLSLAETIKQSGPWGQGFPEPQFEGRFKILSSRVLGEKHLKMELGLSDSKIRVEAIAFNYTDEDWPNNIEEIEVLYRLDVNDFRGSQSLQLILEHVVPLVH